MTRLNATFRLLLLLVAGACATACDATGPSKTCAGGGGPVFSVLPVPLSAIVAVTPIGNMGPPVHTIPTDHGGIYLRGTGIALSSPDALQITSVQTTHYLASPFRAGESDYSVSTKLCGGYQLNFAHIQTVVDKIGRETGGNCSTYSTANETVQSCEKNTNIPMTAGETIGTVGGASAGAFDIGLYQSGRQNSFVNPGRYSGLTRTAVCPYDPFTGDLRSQIDPLIGDPGQPASGEAPLCGTMEVDVADTARGVWVLQSAPVNQEGDETNFVVLAPHPMAPQSKQTFSLGPTALSGSTGQSAPLRYPVMTSGRVNRQFRDVTADGLIYCYAAPSTFFSYFVRLAAGNVLTLQRVPHAGGSTPCNSDPTTWVMDGTALSFIR